MAPIAELENANPTVFSARKVRETLPDEEDDDVTDRIDAREVFGTHFIASRCVNSKNEGCESRSCHDLCCP